MYTPLHNYSHYSLLQGLHSPKEIVEECKNRGYNSVALTDINNMSGCIEFYKTAKDKKIKPIIGIHLQSDEGTLLLYALNAVGYIELLKINSKLNSKESYRGSQLYLTIDELSKFNFTNILVITGHEHSIIYNSIVNKFKIKENWKDLIKYRLNQLFKFIPKDNFYIELQYSEYDTFSDEVKKILIEISKTNNLKIIASPRVYFLKEEDQTLHQILISSKEKNPLKELNQINNSNYKFFSGYKFYLPSYDEISKVFPKEYLEETNNFASRIEDYKILKSPILPKFKCPKGKTSEEYFADLCRIGWENKIKPILKSKKDEEIYAERVKQELAVFKQANLFDYFLIVQDIVQYAKSKNYLVGPSRGSVGGCLTAYLLDITQIDSIKYNLIFERFYNTGRIDTKTDKYSLPDIDMDFPARAREDIINYITKKYGKDNTAQIATYGTLMGRAALKSIFRAYDDTTFSEQNEITKHIPDKAKISDKLEDLKNEYNTNITVIQWTLKNKAKHFDQWCIYKDGQKEIIKDSEKILEYWYSLEGPLASKFEQAIRLEGVHSTSSKHAAGVVIGPSKLEELVPLVFDSKSGKQIIGCPMGDLELAGLCKMDILGLSSLDRIEGINQ